jgi:hypothetical protein
VADDDDNDTPPASTDLPIESWSEFKAKLEDAAGVDKSSLTPEEGANSRPGRQEAPTPENAFERPIVKHKSKGDGPLSLNEAADSLQYSRGLKLRSDLLETGYTDEQVDAHAAAVLENDQNPLHEPPPVEVKLPLSVRKRTSRSLRVRPPIRWPTGGPIKNGKSRKPSQS